MMKTVFTVSAACQNLRTLHGYNVPPARSGITQIPAFRSLQSLWTHEPPGIVINVCSNLCCVYIHLVYHILHCLKFPISASPRTESPSEKIY